MKWLAILCAFILLAPRAALGDTYSYYYYSLEWLVDASDSIVEATLVPSPYKGNPGLSTATVKSIHRTLKHAGKVKLAEADVLPTHLAQGDSHRVLLFTRPDDKRPGERLVYCLYLATDKTPAEKKTDPFGFLPSHSSSWARLAFSYPRCVTIDQAGKVHTDPEAIVRLIETRIKADPKKVTAEGTYIKCSPSKDDGDDHNLLIPETPKKK